MNTIQENERTYTPQFGGNSVTESVNLILELFETYLDAGLSHGDAWDAAVADYTHSFSPVA